MRLLFTSDFQLGGGARLGTPEHPRLEDNARTLGALAHIAARVEVDLIVHAGDVFEHRRPAIDELILFADWIHEAVPCEVAIVAGNHDVRGPGIPTTIELFGTEGLDVFTRPSKIAKGIAALPWAHPGTFRAAGSSDPEELAGALLAVAAGMRAGLDEPAILVTHYALTGMSLPNGLATDELREPVLDSYELADQGWQYVFAGHIHKPGRIGGGDFGTTLVSIGSPWRHDFGEEAITPGVWLLDTEADTLEHVELEDRAFVTIGVGLPGFAVSVPPLGAIVRIRARCSEEEARDFKADELREHLLALGAHKVFIHLDVERRVRARADVGEDSEPLEALERWCKATELEPAIMGERLRDLTKGLLEEVSQ